MKLERAKIMLRNAILHEIDITSCEGYSGYPSGLDLTSFKDLWAEYCPSAPMPEGLVDAFLNDDKILEELEKSAVGGWVILTMSEKGVALDFNVNAFSEWEKDCIEENLIN